MAEAPTFPIMSDVPPPVNSLPNNQTSKRALSKAASFAYRASFAASEIPSPLSARFKLYVVKPLLETSEKLERDLWISENFPEASAETMGKVTALATEWFQAHSDYKLKHSQHVKTYVVKDPVTGIGYPPPNWNELMKTLEDELADKQRGIYQRLKDLRNELNSNPS